MNDRDEAAPIQSAQPADDATAAGEDLSADELTDVVGGGIVNAQVTDAITQANVKNTPASAAQPTDIDYGSDELPSNLE